MAPEIIDISLPITQGMPVYPGNTETAIRSFPSASGQAILSTITISSHVGTHIDSPTHVVKTGSTANLNLADFYGLCRVLDVTKCVGSVSREALEEYDIQPEERILLQTTNSQKGFATFYPDFVYLSSEGARYLSEKNIRLIGIDAWSVKQKGSADNTAHEVLLAKGIPILEGINLAHVTPGSYLLCAFPLALPNLDGAPARAVLLPPTMMGNSTEGNPVEHL